MSYLRNCWYVAGFSEEASSTPFSRTYLETPVVVYRGESGVPVALDNHCPHRFAPLNQGKVYGDVIQCPYHGLRFDSHGTCVGVPSGGGVPPHTKLRAYPITERHRLLWIWMGEPKVADPTLIPDFSYLESKDFGWFNGYLHVNGNYQLLVDNLLDLTHAEFLHPFLSSEGWSARNEQSIRKEGESRIVVENVALRDNILPIMRQMRPDMEVIGTTKQQERWDLPSLIRLSVEYYAAAEQIIIPSGHFLTPETMKSTHYFVRGGHDVEAHNPEFTARIKEGVLNVFRTEDVPMIEAQQRYIGDDDLLNRQPAVLKTDGAALRARRILSTKIKMEQAAFGTMVAAESAS